MASPTNKDAARRYGTIQAVAERFNCSPRTVRRMIADGEITGYRFGPRLLRVDLDEVDRILRPIPSGRGTAA